MPLYGHELSSQLSPVAARLTFAVSFDKDFIGRDALLKEKLEGPQRVLAGFEMVERGVARERYPVFSGDEEIGWVTSGMFSPTTQRYLGMAYLPPQHAKLGAEIQVLVRNKSLKAKIVRRPFYTPAYRK
jgi:aminomethyltransferase